MATHKIWNKVEYWTALKNTAPNWSYAKYLKGLDLKFDDKGNIEQVAEDRQIHKILMVKNFKRSFLGYRFLLLLSLSNFSFVSYITNEIQ